MTCGDVRAHPNNAKKLIAGHAAEIPKSTLAAVPFQGGHRSYSEDRVVKDNHASISGRKRTDGRTHLHIAGRADARTDAVKLAAALP